MNNSTILTWMTFVPLIGAEFNGVEVSPPAVVPR